MATTLDYVSIRQLGKGSKIKLINFAEFSAKGVPFPNFYWLKMMYMLLNGFCMIWEIHLSIFWYLHEGENM